MLKKLNNSLILILFIALILRVMGLLHGFPFIFHPDEPAVVRSVLGIRFFPNPGHFDWPHLHYYLNFAAYKLFIWFRGFLQIINAKPFVVTLFPVLWRDPLIFYYISRFVAALMGAFTIIPVYLTGKRLFGQRAGLFAAIVFSIIPLHVHVSHFALVDVPMVFWGVWALYFSTLITKENCLKYYALAGFFIGLSASTKYNGAFFAIPLVLFHIFKNLHPPRRTLFNGIENLRLVVSGLFAFFGFVLGTPYSILDFDTFMRTDSPVGAMWQFTNVGGVSFSMQLKQFFAALTTEFAYDFGYTFLIVYLAFIVFFIFRRSIWKRYYGLWVLIFTSVFLFFYVSGFDKTRSHYYLFVYPFVALIVGFALANFHVSARRSINLTIISLICVIPLLLSLYRVTLLLRPDTRNILHNWMIENLETEDFLLFNSDRIFPVIEKFSDNPQEKADEEEIYTGEGGYLILGMKDKELQKLMEDKETYIGNFIDVPYTELYFIEAKHRRGPHIIIYSFGDV